MQRQLFETSQHAEAEAAFVKTIMLAKKVKMHKLPISYRLDYLVSDSESRAIALAELKCRNNASNIYPTYAISLAKYDQGLRLTDHLCHDLTSEPIRFLLFVRFTDKDMYYKHSPINSPEICCRWGGRIWDARDEDDREPMVHIPMKFFKDL